MSEFPPLLAAALAGRYEIERELGHGGMATVYLARDLRHGRQVAVKVLLPDIAATLGADRFLREVRIAAGLTHPHILGVHDSGEAGGLLYYVMPYIKGESLGDRIARHGALPVQDAIRFIREVTDALAYAHRHNVVHRDIKPANILLSDRHALVSDFGVAKALSEVTGPKVTTAGVALGTPAYMAPEQATADEHLDHRADIYSVGVVAYEMLVGEPPFRGATSQRVLAAHLTETPRPLSEHRASLPPVLEQFVMKCLEKHPSDRWQSADEMLPVLEALSTPTGGITPAQTVPSKRVTPRAPFRIRASVFAGVFVLVAVVGFLVWSVFRGASNTLEVMNTRQVTRGSELEIEPAISPDGREVAYVTWSGSGLAQINVRDLQGGRPIMLQDRVRSIRPRPVWSADGRTVIFHDSSSAVAAPRFGGPARAVADGRVEDVQGDRIIITRGDSLFIRAFEGGDEKLIVVAASPYSARLSPDGRHIVYLTGNKNFLEIGALFGNVAPSTMWHVSTEGGTPIQISQERAFHASPAWLPDGRHLLFVSDRDGPRDLYLLKLTSSGAPAGRPVRITTGLEPHSVSVSLDGTKAVYTRYFFRRNVWALPLPASGTVTMKDARPVTSGNQVVESHGLSRDGKWLAFDANLEGNQDIYVVSVAGGEPRRLTVDSAAEFHPAFSPDGKSVVFHSAKYGTRDIFLIGVNGGDPRRLTDQPGEEFQPSFSPDGRHIAYGYEAVGENAAYVITRDSLGDGWGTPRRVSRGPVTYPRWSPDGEHLVATRGYEAIILLGLDGSERLILKDADDGLASVAWPTFSPDGKRIYFHGVDQSGRPGLYTVSPNGGHARLAVRFADASRPVWPLTTIGEGVAYLSVAEHEIDIYVMDLVRK